MSEPSVEQTLADHATSWACTRAPRPSSCRPPTSSRAEVTVEKDGQEVNGKSIMGVLMLVAAKGTSITVRCTGDDADAALDALAALVKDKFGED